MTEKSWNIGGPGGPAGPFYSVVKPDGQIVAMQILTQEMAELIASIPQLQAEVERLTERLAQFRAVCQKQSPFDADSCVRCSQYDLCLAEYEEAFSRL